MITTDNFTVTVFADNTAVILVTEGSQLRFATLEKPLKNWIVRRFDWLDPQEGTNPTYKKAICADELMEVILILKQLNGG